MKITLVEHNRSLLNSLSRYLKSIGHEVDATFDGANAINSFDKKTNTIIVDHEITRVPFNIVIERLKEIKPSLKVILLVNSVNVPLDLLINNMNIDAFIPRPFMTPILLDALDASITQIDDNFYSIKEAKLLNALKNRTLLYNEVDEMFFHQDGLYVNYIKSINAKLKSEQIISDEEGFKLVKRNG